VRFHFIISFCIAWTRHEPNQREPFYQHKVSYSTIYLGLQTVTTFRLNIASGNESYLK